MLACQRKQFENPKNLNCSKSEGSIMGMCKPSGGKFDIVGHIGSLKANGIANSRYDLYNESGELIQQRWYGPDGKAILNRDWKHNDVGGKHVYPHDHVWDWSKDSPRQKYTSGEINMDFC